MAALVITPAEVHILADTAWKKVQNKSALDLVEGDVVYQEADGGYTLACAGETLAESIVAGIVITAADEDEYFILATDGTIDIGATLTAGDVFVLGITGGALVDDEDHVEHLSRVGHAVSARVFRIKIENIGLNP